MAIRLIPVLLILMTTGAFAQTVSIKPDADFRIPGAAIPNVGLIGGEVWLVVGGQGGIRLYRSSAGDNDNVSETIPGLNRFVPEKIDLGEENDQLYLLLFGTGLRGRSALSAVTATIGGTPVTAAYAGPQPDFTGLDQVNLILPRSLAGRGEVPVELAVDGRPANPVTVSIGEIPAAAFFEFDSPPRTEKFVIKLNDPVKIKHARDLLSGATTERPHVMGIIVKSPVPWNSPWSYYLDPMTIDFFDFAIEVCDGSMSYIEEHLPEVGGALLPGNRWCPWGSRLIREVTPK